MPEPEKQRQNYKSVLAVVSSNLSENGRESRDLDLKLLGGFAMC